MKHEVTEYLKAAENGDAVAQFHMGRIYHEGLGVPQNFKEALRWYQMAAEQGVDGAQSNIGIMYSEGQGVEQNFKEALKWFEKAADKGYLSAQFNLGLMHAKGEGTPRNLVLGHYWLKFVLEGSDENANELKEQTKELIEIIEDEMTEEQIQEAKKLQQTVSVVNNAVRFVPLTRLMSINENGTCDNYVNEVIQQIPTIVKEIGSLSKQDRGVSLGRSIIVLRSLMLDLNNNQTRVEGEFLRDYIEVSRSIDAHLAYNAMKYQVGYQLSWQDAAQKILDYVLGSDLRNILNTNSQSVNDYEDAEIAIEVAVDFVDKVVASIID